MIKEIIAELESLTEAKDLLQEVLSEHLRRGTISDVLQRKIEKFFNFDDSE